jgi:RimJ/RimL family protein N-acetyltransferase
MRNKVYLNLSGHPRKISIFQQFKFWLTNKSYEIIIFSHNGSDLGYVLFVKIDDIDCITVVIDTKFQGQGYADIVLNQAIKTYKKEIKIFTTEILQTNIKSISFFEKNGFKLQAEKNGILYYQYVVKN